MYIVYSTVKEIFVVKVNSLTDFVFKTSEMRELIEKYINQMKEKFPENIDKDQALELFEQYRTEVVEIFKEKKVNLSFLHSKADGSIINEYRYERVHGDDFVYSCLGLVLIFSDTRIEKDGMLDCAAELLGYEFANYLESKDVNIETETNIEFKPKEYYQSAVSTSSIIYRHKDKKIYKILALQPV